MRDLKDAHAKNEIPLFKEKIQSYKNDLKQQHLILSEEAYIELKNKPEHHLSLKEFVQVQVFETLIGYMNDLNKYQGET